MRTIMEAHVDLGVGGRKSVAEILSNASNYGECREAIERHGLAVVSTYRGTRTFGIDGQHRLFVNITAVSRYLLKFTTWQDLDIGQLLERLPDARWDRHRISGKQAYGLSLPTVGNIELSTEKAKEQMLSELNTFTDDTAAVERKKPDKNDSLTQDGGKSNPDKNDSLTQDPKPGNEDPLSHIPAHIKANVEPP